MLSPVGEKRRPTSALRSATSSRPSSAMSVTFAEHPEILNMQVREDEVLDENEMVAEDDEVDETAEVELVEAGLYPVGTQIPKEDLTVPADAVLETWAVLEVLQKGVMHGVQAVAHASFDARQELEAARSESAKARREAEEAKREALEAKKELQAAKRDADAARREAQLAQLDAEAKIAKGSAESQQAKLEALKATREAEEEAIAKADRENREKQELATKEANKADAARLMASLAQEAAARKEVEDTMYIRVWLAGVMNEYEGSKEAVVEEFSTGLGVPTGSITLLSVVAGSVVVTASTLLLSTAYPATELKAQGLLGTTLGGLEVTKVRIARSLHELDDEELGLDVKAAAELEARRELAAIRIQGQVRRKAAAKKVERQRFSVEGMMLREDIAAMRVRLYQEEAKAGRGEVEAGSSEQAIKALDVLCEAGEALTEAAGYYMAVQDLLHTPEGLATLSAALRPGRDLVTNKEGYLKAIDMLPGPPAMASLLSLLRDIQNAEGEEDEVEDAAMHLAAEGAMQVLQETDAVMELYADVIEQAVSMAHQAAEEDAEVRARWAQEDVQRADIWGDANVAESAEELETAMEAYP